MYFIGKGRLEINFPPTIQSPDCGYSVTGYEIISASAQAMSAEQIEKSIEINFEDGKLEVETDDFIFNGQ